MKRGLVYILTLSFLWIHSYVHGQSSYQINKDSLDYFFRRNDLVSYFNKTKILASIAADTLMDQQKLDTIGAYLLNHFDTLSTSERYALRYAAMIVGRRYNRRFGNYDKALQFYLLANQNAEDKEYLDKNSWYIENEINNIYTRKGDYQKADYFAGLFEKSIKYLIKTYPADSVLIQRLSGYYANRGIQRQSEGNQHESFQYYRDGFRLADSIAYPSGRFANALGLAEFYMDSSQFGLSEQYLKIARGIIPDLRDDPRYDERHADLLFLTAQFYLIKGKEQQNKTLIRQSIPIFKSAVDTLGQYYKIKRRREFAKYYTPLAEAYLDLDSLKESEHAIHLGLSSIIGDYNRFELPPRPDQLYAENSFIELFRLQSQLLTKQYQSSGKIDYLEKALESIDLALKANDIIRDQVIADQSKLIAIRDNKRLTHEGLKITYSLYSQSATPQFLDKVRDLFNRSKALLLDEKIRRHRLMQQISSEDSTQLAYLQMEIRQLHSDKFITDIDIDSINRLILNDQEQMDHLYNRYKELTFPIEQRGDYIEYSIQDEDIFALSSIHGSERFIRLGSKREFLGLLKRMDDFLRLREWSEDRVVLHKLFHFLIEPILSEFPGKIVIIPDGEIGFVPFDMLEDGQGKPLIEYSTISYAFQFDTYKTEREKAIPNYEIYCLAPAYSDTEKKMETITRGSIYQLPYAQAEADSIRKLFGAHALISDVGDKADMANALKQATIFHFAGHAMVRKDNAFLVMNSDSVQQNRMTEEEIALLPYSADLVVLSACETGLGQFETGEGIRSLGRSFMESGASATIMSLWSINDKSTSMIMAAFYKFLLLDMAKDEALRKAKLEYIAKAGKFNQHPYFWAAFIPAGDMRPMANRQ